jgi:hypothetical protein
MWVYKTWSRSILRALSRSLPVSWIKNNKEEVEVELVVEEVEGEKVEEKIKIFCL